MARGYYILTEGKLGIYRKNFNNIQQAREFAYYLLTNPSKKGAMGDWGEPLIYIYSVNNASEPYEIVLYSRYVGDYIVQCYHKSKHPTKRLLPNGKTVDDFDARKAKQDKIYKANILKIGFAKK